MPDSVVHKPCCTTCTGFTEYQQYIEFQHSDEEDEDELAGALLLGNGEQHERPQGLRGVFASLWKVCHADHVCCGLAHSR